MYIYVCGVENGNYMVEMFIFFVALRVCVGVHNNSDASFTHLFYLILHHVDLEE